MMDWIEIVNSLLYMMLNKDVKNIVDSNCSDKC